MLKKNFIEGKDFPKDDIILSILTWGPISGNPGKSKSNLFDKLNLTREEIISEIRFFPLTWDSNNNKVINWCMVALIEIDSDNFQSE